MLPSDVTDFCHVLFSSFFVASVRRRRRPASSLVVVIVLSRRCRRLCSRRRRRFRRLLSEPVTGRAHWVLAILVSRKSVNLIVSSVAFSRFEAT